MKHSHSCSKQHKRPFTYHPKDNRDHKKSRKRWHTTNKAFRCHHCQQMVFPAEHIGTTQRNHCPHCLWSCHVDTKPGNRASTCHGGMEPVGLTFKHNGFDKYGRARTGDVMLIHHCQSCGTINLNRIAGDDCLIHLFDIFDRAERLSPVFLRKLSDQGICLLTRADKARLHHAIYGKSYRPDTLTRDP